MIDDDLGRSASGMVARPGAASAWSQQANELVAFGADADIAQREIPALPLMSFVLMCLVRSWPGNVAPVLQVCAKRRGRQPRPGFFVPQIPMQRRGGAPGSASFTVSQTLLSSAQAGAAVQAEVIDTIKADKVITYVKRRRKHSSQRTRGHRQQLTLVRIT
ncbi:bL21 family ribosomal protein, partial [Paracoccus sp. APAP_BH8]|uniref:bL21 family ribosomal protein n=1 Tax=Paracoccus sp. APAP_BH8 TaxID=3110237 RepID=UPI002FD86179